MRASAGAANGIGQPVRRKEDFRLLTGRGCYGDDLALIARAKASFAHSPLAFSRRGGALESFQRYLDAGINMALGTDTYPLDMFAEMRTTAAVCKIIEKNHESAGALDVFTASNLGGARALRRDDLGRLARGAKAGYSRCGRRDLVDLPGRQGHARKRHRTRAQAQALRRLAGRVGHFRSGGAKACGMDHPAQRR